MPSSSSQPTIAIILTWPDIKNAEYEVVQRLCIAATSVGARATIVDNDGYPIWSTFKHIDATVPRINRSEYDFAISFHFESPRLFDVYSYSALWNPLEFYFVFGYEKSSMKLVSHNDALSCGSQIADSHALNLFDGLGRPVADLPTLFHAPPEPYLPPVITNTSKLFYIGINWERIGGPKGRHHGLLERLDDEDLIAIYGPDVFQGGRPWEGFKTYRGPIPFDGRSVIKKLNEAGICLALSSRPHQLSGIMSNRLFEGLAAGTVVISNRHPIVEKYFTDCVYIVDDEHLDPAELTDVVRDLVLQIRKNPEESQRRAELGQKRLAEIFSLERSIEALIAGHGARQERAATGGGAPVLPRVSVVLIYTQSSRKEFDCILQNVLRQEGVAIDLVCLCDRRLAEEVAALIEACRPCLGSIAIETRDFYDIVDFRLKSARRLCGTGAVLHAVLERADADYVALLGRDDHWFSDHLSSLAAALARSPAAQMAVSGLLIEEPAQDGRTARRIEELAFARHAALLNVTETAQGGRFLYRRDVALHVRPATMALLDGEETGLLNLTALLKGGLCQTNYATYVSLADEVWKRPRPVVPPEQQQQFIRDSVAGDPVWQAMRAHAVPAPPVVFATASGATLRWDRYALPAATAPLVQPDRIYRVAFEGDGLCYLGKGFSYPEPEYVWIEDDVAELRFQLPDRRDGLDLRLTCFARSPGPSRQGQGVTITLNDLPVAYTQVRQSKQTLRLPLPPKLLAKGDDFKIAILPDWGEPIQDAAGAILDKRRLSVAVADFALVTSPPRIRLGEVLDTRAGAPGLNFLLTGFAAPDPSAVWLEGRHASLAFQIEDEAQAATELVLEVTGRPSREGQPQSCSVSVDDAPVCEFHLATERHQIVIPLGPSANPSATRHIDLDLAFAEPYYAADGTIADERLLPMILFSLCVRRVLAR